MTGAPSSSDVFRCGSRILFQGPPLLNFWPILKTSDYFTGELTSGKRGNRLIYGDAFSEIRIISDARRVAIKCQLGDLDLAVQPNESAWFEGKRVLLTISKNNDLTWVRDWVGFHSKNHGSDAVLIYDNNSDKYSVDEIKSILTSAFPKIVLEVVSWPFKFGPQGGMSGAVDGNRHPGIPILLKQARCNMRDSASCAALKAF